MKIARLLLGVLLGALVLFVTSLIISAGPLRDLTRSSQWLSAGTMTQFSMLVLSLLLMLALGRGRLGDYGFRMATRQEVRIALVRGSIAAAAVQAAVAVFWRFLPPAGEHPALEGSSLLRLVITVWLIASTCEEVFLRGLIQGFLKPLQKSGITILGYRLSVPVLTAAILFGAMHIMLVTLGADRLLVGGIVASALVLGLVAGYYREKTGSLVPAILIHMLFNIFGWVAQNIQSVLAG